MFSWVCTIMDFGLLYDRVENSGLFLGEGREQLELAFIRPTFLLTMIDVWGSELSVFLFVRMEKRDTHWMDFGET